MAQNLKLLLKLLRIKQWIKNVFILFPLIFSGNLRDAAYFTDTLVTFLGFCLLSSSVYILNDFLDREKDRHHPKKSHRPLAQKKFSAPAVTLLILSLMTAGLLSGLSVDPIILWMGITYVLLHLAYNFYAKRIVILDVIFVAIGFQIRIWAGAYAANVLPSVWLQLCVFLLALFLGFNKRRHELELLQSQASEHREALAHYTTYLLDQIIIICSTLSIVFYGLYTISSEIVTRTGNHDMAYSIVFVIYGMFRYLYLVHVKNIGDDPAEVLFLDKPLMIAVFAWVAFNIFILYRHSFPF